MREAVLSISDLCVDFELRDGRAWPVLSAIDLDLKPAEIVGIAGESGCGKSTLSNTIMRLLPHNARVRSGSIVLDGRDLLSISEREMREVRGGQIGMVFQDPATSLNPSFRIGSQMMDVAHVHKPGATRSALRAGAEGVLREVGIPDVEARLRAYPHQCSGGMRQRVMIATALQLQPKLLIADEITSALDVTLERQIIELLRRLRDDHGTAIAFICHDLGVVANISDRVLIMYAGRVVETGRTADVFSRPRHPYTLALLTASPSYKRRHSELTRIPGRVPPIGSEIAGCAFAQRCSFAQQICREVPPPLKRVGGSSALCHFAEAIPAPAAAHATRRAGSQKPDPATAPQPIVRVESLSVAFSGRRSFRERVNRSRSPIRAVDGIDLELVTGEVVGLVGESGAGKSTLGRAIVGLVRPTHGRVEIDGVDLASRSSRDLRRLRRELQMIFQDAQASLDPRQRVRELLTEPYKIHKVPPEDRQSPQELLEAVELSADQADSFPHELSGGQARRVSIARCLSLNPRFIVADEPSAGLDVSAAAGVLDLMLKLRAERHLTLLFITHNLNLLGYAADRIAVMYLGEIVELSPSDALFEEPAHPYTVGLLGAVSDPDTDAIHVPHRMLVAGDIPSPRNPPPGCRYHTRCPLAQDVCRSSKPPLKEIGPGRFAACHFADEVRAGVDQTARVAVLEDVN
jgi:peptide/nickel transport system ATP-binding protein